MIERPPFDWRDPDYGPVVDQRMASLRWLRAHPDDLAALKEYYRECPADFINDWGWTFDPRNAERGLPTMIPFVLFPKQREWIDWVLRHWKQQTPGLCEKSRDMGISWLATSLACTLCIFHPGLAIGFGSRLTDYVDKIGTMKPLLPKARVFMENLPEEFRGGWVPWRDSPYMRLNFPDTGSLVTGEGGDQIGRGDRASIYFIDEAAYLDRPDLVERSLSQTTNCRIDMSSVNGMNNPFAKKRHEGKIDVFVFDWRDDPRKDEEWYRLLSADANEGGKGLDPVTIAQEVDRDYSASVEGILIPNAWVRAAIGACDKLGIKPTGPKVLALDVADEGVDKNAACVGHGVQIEHIEEWSGKGADLFATTSNAFALCDEHGCERLRYDADGLGAGIRGDARIINATRQQASVRQIPVEAFRGSEKVVDPDSVVEGTVSSGDGKGRTNKDYFQNRKAQGWFRVRRMFQKTHRWVVENIRCDPDDIISLNPKMPLLGKLVSELSQPTRTFHPTTGRMLIDKKPDGMKSPNLADSVMIRYAQIDSAGTIVSQDVLMQVAAAGVYRRRRS